MVSHYDQCHIGKDVFYHTVTLLVNLYWTSLISYCVTTVSQVTQTKLNNHRAEQQYIPTFFVWLNQMPSTKQWNLKVVCLWRVKHCIGFSTSALLFLSSVSLTNNLDLGSKIYTRSTFSLFMSSSNGMSKAKTDSGHDDLYIYGKVFEVRGGFEKHRNWLIYSICDEFSLWSNK